MPKLDVVKLYFIVIGIVVGIIFALIVSQPYRAKEPAVPNHPKKKPLAKVEHKQVVKKNLLPVRIPLPRATFTRTPAAVLALMNLEPLVKSRGPFLAPIGTKNMALGKPVTSSDSEPIVGELSYVTDGESEGVDGTFVELAPYAQWVQIDLEEDVVIYAIVVWHYFQEPRVYHDVVVKVSDKPDFKKDSITVFNNDTNNSSGHGKGTDRSYVEDYQGKLMDCKGIVGRYVKLYSNCNTSGEASHYTEVHVYGKPVKKCSGPTRMIINIKYRNASILK